MQAELHVARELRRIGDEFNQLYFHQVRNRSVCARRRVCMCTFTIGSFSEVDVENACVYSISRHHEAAVSRTRWRVSEPLQGEAEGLSRASRLRLRFTALCTFFLFTACLNIASFTVRNQGPLLSRCLS